MNVDKIYMAIIACCQLKNGKLFWSRFHNKKQIKQIREGKDIGTEQIALYSN